MGALEFYQQGDEERRIGLPISALCDRGAVGDFGKSQKGFVEFVCLPLFEALAQHEAGFENDEGAQDFTYTWEQQHNKPLLQHLKEQQPHRCFSEQDWGDSLSVKDVHGKDLDLCADLDQISFPVRVKFLPQVGELEARVEQHCIVEIKANASRW